MTPILAISVTAWILVIAFASGAVIFIGGVLGIGWGLISSKRPRDRGTDESNAADETQADGGRYRVIDRPTVRGWASGLRVAVENPATGAVVQAVNRDVAECITALLNGEDVERIPQTETKRSRALQLSHSLYGPPSVGVVHVGPIHTAIVASTTDESLAQKVADLLNEYGLPTKEHVHGWLPATFGGMERKT